MLVCIKILQINTVFTICEKNRKTIQFKVLETHYCLKYTAINILVFYINFIIKTLKKLLFNWLFDK